ncbi:MAG: ABC transporter permease [Nanoarchaeota archaeon]|nr:ABC transporter permease [Nanoarchaeota archaeon]MBU1030483.1 ABC transporter permease [Nanoarchaeota archaeon]
MRVKHALSLIKEFAIVDLKLKYQGSVLGYFWSLLNPLLMLITLYLVFSLIVKFDIPHYQLYLLLGILIWNFLSEATNGSMHSIISKSGLMRKFIFPKESIIIGSCLASFVSFLLNLLVFFLFMIIFRVDISLKILILPFYLLQLFVFVLGVSFFLSSFYVRYRDIIHIWSFLLLMGFFITPITYPLEIVPFHLLKYYLLNPLARMVVDMRYVALYNYIPDLKNFLITLIISVFVFVFGYLIFRKRKSHFVEEI